MTAGGKGSGIFYSLNAVPAPANPTPLGKQVAVADPTALMAYDSEKVLSQGQAGQVESLNNLKWSDTVPKLVQAKIVQSFENAGALGEVNRPIDGSTPDYQLLTEIRRFQIVQGPQPVAEAEISAKLVGNDGHIVAARVFSAKEPVQSKEDAEAARALSTAFGGIVTNLIAWTREFACRAGSQRAGWRACGKRESGEQGKEAPFSLALTEAVSIWAPAPVRFANTSNWLCSAVAKDPPHPVPLPKGREDA